MDYAEYLRLIEVEQDKLDYDSAIETKRKTKKWTSRKELKEGLEL